MALSCQNQIFMARSYTQCLPNIVQRVKDDGQIRAICYFQMVNIEQGEATVRCLRSRDKYYINIESSFALEKKKLISPIEFHCTNYTSFHNSAHSTVVIHST